MDKLPDTPDEPELLPDYRESRWLRFDGGPSYWGDPVTSALFIEALDFLDALTAQFDESGPWSPILRADLLEALAKHNQQAQSEGRLGDGEELTLIHVMTLSRRRLQAFEETGWNLTHYEHLVRFVDTTINQALMDMMRTYNPELTYAILLASLPPEDILEEDDPAYPDVEADGGCRTCTSGQPCWARVEEDISEIITRSGLSAIEQLPCLQWLIETGHSSLTHSLDTLAEAFTADHQQATESRAATVLVFEANGNDLIVLAIDLARTEANLLKLAQQEAARLKIAVDQINLRFAAG